MKCPYCQIDSDFVPQAAVDALTYVINEHTFDNSIEVNKLLNELELNKTKVLMIESEKRSV